MLFRRNIEPNCAYCKHGMTLGFAEVACKKRGIMADVGRCGEFRYEPTKRRPEYAQNSPLVRVREGDLVL